MKISEVQSRMEHFELLRPYAIAFRDVDAVVNFIVTLRTDTGLMGLGTAAPEPHVTGETVEACGKALGSDSLDWLIGGDTRSCASHCRELERRMPDTPAARAAVDIALHDLLAQHLGIPLVELLGRVHDKILTSVTIGIQSVDATIAAAEEHISHGFRILKVKLGHSVEEDIERLRKLRERVGKSVAIRVDSNQGYGFQEFCRFVNETKELDIEFIEQPIPVAEDNTLRELPQDVRARIAMDESLLNEADAIRLIAPPGVCGTFNIKLMKCGGVQAAGRIATIAEAAGIHLMWGCMDESIISIAAALHAALASPATRYLDLDGSLDLSRDVVTGGFELEDGYMSTHCAPGLGVSLKA